MLGVMSMWKEKLVGRVTVTELVWFKHWKETIRRMILDIQRRIDPPQYRDKVHK